MPINQEDLALTLMTFSTVVLDSLKKLDITLSRDEEEAYFHAWRVVGDIMGVLPELNPSQVADGRALIEAIATRQYASNEAGQAVTKALVDFLEASIPVRLLKGLPSTMIRHLVGDHVSDLLAVQRPTLVSHMLMEVAIEFFKIADRLENESEIVRRISRPFALHLLQHLETLERGGNRMMFHIPATLREQWGLN